MWPFPIFLLLSLVYQGDRVLLMGDSEAYLLSYEFPALAKRDGMEFKTVAVAGSSVISWSQGLGPQWDAIRRFHPDVVLVSLGANDGCMGVRVVRNEKPFLEAFMRKLRRVGAREVVWMGPPKIGVPTKKDGRSKLPQATAGLEEFAALVKTTGVPFLDAREIEVAMWDDQLHCSRPQYPKDPANGCSTWAGWVWGAITTSQFTFLWGGNSAGP